MIRGLDENEIKLLSIISRFFTSNREADIDSIIYLMGIKVPSLLNCWEKIAESLLDKEIISCDTDSKNKTIYTITELGKRFSDEVESGNYLNLYFYNEFYKRAEISKAHAEFCRLVYGKDFCQHGMLDMNQLHKLIEVMKLDSIKNVLELGCGNGFITEYISDKTQCYITGVDIAEEAIEHAKERTMDKKDRIAFEARDMENLDYEEQSFNAVISIDTLYFVKDLENTLKSIFKVLKPEGAMYIFYHVPPDVMNNSSTDPAKDSMLGKALCRMNCKYQTVDFTKENKKHWEVKKQVLLELKPKFEQEGNMFLYSNRMAECMGNLGEFYRFLYMVNVNKRG